MDDHRAVAEAIHQPHVVGDENDRLALRAQLVEHREALLLERRVTDREHLVDQQYVGVRLHHGREGKPHLHAGRVVLELEVDEGLELGELDHVIEAGPCLARTQAHHHRIDRHVLGGGQVGIEPDPQLDERCQPARDPDTARVDAVDACEALEQGALPGAVATEDAEELALHDPKRDVLEHVQLVVAVLPEGVQRTLLEGVRAVFRDAEGLVDLCDLDCWRRWRRHQAPSIRTRQAEPGSAPRPNPRGAQPAAGA